MKRKIRRLTGCIALTFLCMNLYGQNTNPRIFAGMGGGISFPQGSFAAGDIFNNKAGFATQGTQITLAEGGMRLDENFGIYGSWKYGSNALDAQAIANQYASETGEQFEIKCTRWYSSTFYAGIFITVPVKRINLDFRFTPGLSLYGFPELSAISKSIDAYQSAEPAQSWSVDIGAAARMQISETISLSLSADFIKSRPEFTVNTEINGDYEKGVFAQPVSLLSYSVGLVYNIY